MLRHPPVVQAASFPGASVGAFPITGSAFGGAVGPVTRNMLLDVFRYGFTEDGLEVIDGSGNGYNLEMDESNCGTWDNAAYLLVPELVGTETVVSSGGTSTPSISAGRIDFTAGTCWNLVLSNGSIYQFSEGAGLEIADIVNEYHGTFTNGTEAALWANTQPDYHPNIIRGGSKVMYFNGIDAQYPFDGYDLTNSFVFSGWFKIPNQTYNQPILSDSTSAAGGDRRFLFKRRSGLDNKLSILVGVGELLGASAIPDNDWIYLHWVYSADTKRHYLTMTHDGITTVEIDGVLDLISGTFDNVGYGGHVSGVAGWLSGEVKNFRMQEPDDTFGDTSIAFQEPDGLYTAWCYGSSFYDAEVEQYVQIYTAGGGHTDLDKKVYCRFRDSEGVWSNRVIISDYTGSGYGSTCHAAGLLSNGDYLAIVRVNDGVSSIWGTRVFRSINYGVSWVDEGQFSEGGSPINPEEAGDIFVTSTNTILTYYRSSGGSSFITRSIDNGSDWSNKSVTNSFGGLPLEGSFVQIADGTIVAVVRKTVSSAPYSPDEALYTISIDDGLTWSGLASTDILNMGNGNASIIYDADTDLLEIWYSSRAANATGIFYASTTGQRAKTGLFGPSLKTNDGTSSRDFGYPSVARGSNGERVMTWYDGSSVNTKIYNRTVPQSEDYLKDFLLVLGANETEAVATIRFKYIPALLNQSIDAAGFQITNPAGSWIANPETKFQMKAANPALLFDPFWSADHITYDAKSWADIIALVSKSIGINQTWAAFRKPSDVCNAINVWAYEEDTYLTPGEYNQNVKWKGSDPCGSGNMVPLMVDDGFGGLVPRRLDEGRIRYGDPE